MNALTLVLLETDSADLGEAYIDGELEYQDVETGLSQTRPCSHWRIRFKMLRSLFYLSQDTFVLVELHSDPPTLP